MGFEINQWLIKLAVPSYISDSSRGSVQFGGKPNGSQLEVAMGVENMTMLGIRVNLLSHNKHHHFCCLHRVDGRKPAPLDKWFIPLFAGSQPFKVVQDFLHPQYG